MLNSLDPRSFVSSEYSKTSNGYHRIKVEKRPFKSPSVTSTFIPSANYDASRTKFLPKEASVEFTEKVIKALSPKGKLAKIIAKLL